MPLRNKNVHVHASSVKIRPSNRRRLTAPCGGCANVTSYRHKSIQWPEKQQGWILHLLSHHLTKTDNISAIPSLGENPLPHCTN